MGFFVWLIRVKLVVKLVLLDVCGLENWWSQV